MLYAAFLSMFALDVFGEGCGFWRTILALMVHLIPTGLLLVALLIAWRWEWAGALMFVGLGALYSARVFHHHPGWILTIAGPLFLVGVLFLIDWLLRRELRVG